MPRKHDPIAVQVLKFYSDAPLDAAELVLQLGKAIIDGRRKALPAPKVVGKPAGKANGGAKPAAAVAAAITMPTPRAPQAPQAAPKRATRRQMAAEAQGGTATRQEDVPLPGLQAPAVPVIGG